MLGEEPSVPRIGLLRGESSGVSLDELESLRAWRGTLCPPHGTFEEESPLQHPLMSIHCVIAFSIVNVAFYFEAEAIGTHSTEAHK